MSTTTTYALRISSSSDGAESTTIGYFATPEDAVTHFRERDDLRGYFWKIQHGEFPADHAITLPEIVWTPEGVAAALERDAAA